jgi:hypothetical protein
MDSGGYLRELALAAGLVAHLVQEGLKSGQRRNGMLLRKDSWPRTPGLINLY